MKSIAPHPWKVIQNEFSIKENLLYESLMSLGNGHMGHRGTFEEGISCSTLPGHYMAGVYYPDKTKVGWWKNGYPPYFAKVLNAMNPFFLSIQINGVTLDLNIQKPSTFLRTLNMKKATLSRCFSTFIGGTSVEISSKRFISGSQNEVGVLRYTIKALDDIDQLEILSALNGNIRNADAHDDTFFWTAVEDTFNEETACLSMTTKKTNFQVSAALDTIIDIDGVAVKNLQPFQTDLVVGQKFSDALKSGQTLTLYKFFAMSTSRDYEKSTLPKTVRSLAKKSRNLGFSHLFSEHKKSWNDFWEQSDITIESDIAAQQGIRFCLFHLHQAYTGEDARLNIGPKGLTGEKYGGSTYWDTEAYCLPFFLATAPSKISKNLLLYRYNHLEKAIENGKKLGLQGALYPMVTMNGEECHNEWEITFEEIHRNGAIAYALYNYVRHTGDKDYLFDYGLDVLINLCRFWESRVHYHPQKKCYMILGVTGPNEYENNVNNNWYTNYMAAFTLSYTNTVITFAQKKSPHMWQKTVNKYNIDIKEVLKWSEISNNMYYPELEGLNLIAQQDGYMDKAQQTVCELSVSDLPLNQNWSWDKILRSCFIKQADVLQGLFFFKDAFEKNFKKTHFDFYEPRTVHESSLSPGIHSVLAADIGYLDKAYKLFLRSVRLDLDNRNNDSDDGLHITSMTGGWLALVYGFAGFSIKRQTLSFSPSCPKNWSSFSFPIAFRERRLFITVDQDQISIQMLSGSQLKIYVYDKLYTLPPEKQISISLSPNQQ